MRIKHYLLVFSVFFIVLEMFFVAASVTFFVSIEHSEFVKNANRDFGRIYKENSETILKLSLQGESRSLDSFLKKVSEAEKASIEFIREIDSSDSKSTNLGFAKSFFQINDGIKSVGIVTMRREFSTISSQHKYFVAIFLLAQVLVFFGIILLVHRWTLNSVVEPFEKLISEAKTGNLSVRRALSRSIPKEIEVLSNLLSRLWNGFRERSVQAALGKVSAQVAHDIRSPLSALSVIERDLTGLSDAKRILLRDSISRIRDIANNLLDTNRLAISIDVDSVAAPVSGGATSPQMIVAILDSIFVEKKLQFFDLKNVDFEFRNRKNFYGVFSVINSFDFKRIISNLINNSVESLGERGQIQVKLSHSGNFLKVSVLDNGVGIPEENINKVAAFGSSFGKTEGTGLGLYHAKTLVEAWGGALSVSSVVGEGTTVSILLPKAVSPSWYVPSVRIGGKAFIVVLDDDLSVHRIWKRRFRPFSNSWPDAQFVYFSNSIQLKNWIISNSQSLTATSFLLDQELLGSDRTGIDIINEYNLASCATLVTSGHEDVELIRKCYRYGVRILPKCLMEAVPVD